MAVLLRLAAGVVLVAHGLVHLLYQADDVDEFSLDNGWFIPEASRRPVSVVMMGATVAGFVLVALAVWGVPGLRSIWPALLLVGAALSLVLLISFWSWSLVFGALIDIVLIAVAVVRPDWTDRIG